MKVEDWFPDQGIKHSELKCFLSYSVYTTIAVELKDIYHSLSSTLKYNEIILVIYQRNAVLEKVVSQQRILKKKNLLSGRGHYFMVHLYR